MGELMCPMCNIRKRPNKGIVNGKRVYRKYCITCKGRRDTPEKRTIHNKLVKENKRLNGTYKVYRKKRKNKKDHCEKCGFVGHFCQFDVDHIDGNHDNNESSNLQTLCANCHRLKTYENKEFLQKSLR